jgi:hypothetical protein
LAHEICIPLFCTFEYFQGLKGKHVAKEDDGDDEIKGILQVFRVFKLARIFKLARYTPLNGNFPRFGKNREMENISRGPTFGDFVTIRTEASLQDITVASRGLLRDVVYLG